MVIRLQSLGYKIENEPKAMVYTKAPLNFKALYKQRVRWTYGFLRNSWNYKKMFLNSDHGNLGIIVFPTSIISIFAVIFFLILFVLDLFNNIWEQIIKISITGIDVSFPSFDPFYINTSSIAFVVYVLLAVTFSFIIIGKRLAGEKKLLGIDVPLYLSLYGFIAPIWITSATVKALFRIDGKWR